MSPVLEGAALYDQTVNFTGPDGMNVPIPMSIITAYVKYGIEICINYASQIGASSILFVLILILTKHEKRRSPIFILNALSLLVNIIRSILQCLYFTGRFYSPYATLVGDYSQVPISEYNISIAATCFNLIMLICIEASLILQLRVVCITMDPFQKVCLLTVSILTALLAVAFRFALTIENSIAILNTENFTNYVWLSSGANITASISICFFSVCFCGKLGFAIRNRRRLGLKQFGPMQIIFVMGCQTMTIPALFSILQYVTDIPEFSSQTLTIVAIFLPLSAIWAGVGTDGSQMASSGPDAHRKLFGSWVTRTRNHSTAPDGTLRKFSQTATYNSHVDSHFDIDPLTPASDGSKATDIELGDREIYIDRSFSVSSEKNGGRQTAVSVLER